MTRLVKILLAFCVAGLIVGVGTVAGLFWHFSHGLPDHKQLADYQPPTVSRLYASDGRLLAEYAKEKRIFVPVAAMPKRLLEAFVAAEDQRFYSHPGVDVIGMIRAAITDLANPGKRPEGASGITQQVAKNFLLSNQATLARKIREAILAFRIEETYSKDRILELYLNEIYLGSGNYGVASAALNYFDRSLGELSLSEMAYLAALPKAPNRYNIVRNEKDAYARRDYVLARMRDDGYITAAEEQAAKAEKLQYRKRGPTEVVSADFFAEEARRNLLSAYGDKGLYEGGLTVMTSLDPAIQEVADKALRAGLIDYDRRHGWRGPYARIADMSTNWQEEFARIQQRRPLYGPPTWQLAVVTKVEPQQVQIGGLPDNGEGTVPFAEMQWARPTLPEQNVGGYPGRPANVVSVGDVIVVEKVEKGANNKPYPANTYALRQVPNVNGAVVVMEPQTGRILAMSGGWSYGMSQFNRAVQAQRQPGSSFKPFVYLAAMDAGITPSTLVLDAPFEYDPGHGQPIWRPGNYQNEESLGPATVRRGLELSRNLMTVRMAQQIGMKRVVDVAKEFGIADNMGAYLPMALGAVDTTLLRMTMAHAMLANGAHEITPSLIDRVQDRDGKTIYRHEPRVCEGCGEAAAGQKPKPPRIVDPRKPFHDPASVYQVVNMMLGVTTRGTAAQLAALGRPIAGKTGTTNDSKDTWFLGSTPDLTIGIYVGFDEPRTLGRSEQGSFTAAPIYERIAKVVYKDKPPVPFRIPPGLRIVRVNHDTGQPTYPGDPQAIDEAFKPGTEPTGDNQQVLDGSAAISGVDPSEGGSVAGGGGPRPTLTGTGETY
ncbi:penicillin-binding protein 1A [Enhydrobacter aerosaccus]|uniref:Penicillin-binding protein 1A n=1 Tax=Enhydrobacter aerosaccus TaxID=225324 RepID=A0A1T4LML1_9HYPH|nr:penicillin-binding protein 1A [Enhydrobacter aerosaccus]SJZ55990.1 penicillin-binding protein 1A [Enhydrobacter aerosaccus]